MRTSRGLALFPTGGIATFAVRIHPGFLNMPLIGLMTMATATAFWLPRRNVSIIRAVAELRAFLPALERPAGDRVPSRTCSAQAPDR